jgi:dihydroxyacetone kinase-like predicted kinase
MKVVLEDTPNLLPVLKTAGVVDSGGQGLVEIIEGCYCALIGKEIETKLPDAYAKPKTSTSSESAGSSADIKFGYCTEFIIMLEKKFDTMEENKMKKFLSSIGDSIVCVADDDIVKIHVHTNDPGLAIQKGLSYGSLTRIQTTILQITTKIETIVNNLTTLIKGYQMELNFKTEQDIEIDNETEDVETLHKGSKSFITMMNKREEQIKKEAE